MMLSPKKYVPLRTKVLEMSLEVDDAEEHGSTGYGPSATGNRARGKGLRKKLASILPRAGVRVCSNCMSTSSLVRVCGMGLQ